MLYKAFTVFVELLEPPTAECIDCVGLLFKHQVRGVGCWTLNNNVILAFSEYEHCIYYVHFIL